MADKEMFDWNENKEKKNRFSTTRLMILTGWLLLLIICLCIIFSNLYMILVMGVAPGETLANWGSTVLGFLFGSFVTMVREFTLDSRLED